MAVFTNKDLHEVILESKKYLYIKDNYLNYKEAEGTILNTLKALGPQTMSWTTWFDSNEDLCEFLYKMNKYTIPKDDAVISQDVYYTLVYFLEKEKNTNDVTLKPLIDLLKKNFSTQLSKVIELLHTKESYIKSQKIRTLCAWIKLMSSVSVTGFLSCKKVFPCFENIINAVLEMVDTDDKIKKMSNVDLRGVEMSLGMAKDKNNTFGTTYSGKVIASFNKVQQELKKREVPLETNFKIDQLITL